MPLVAWRWLSCERMFRTVRTHVRSKVLTGDMESDKRSIREAIEEGRCHMANDQVHDSTGFAFWGETQAGQLVSMGEEGVYTGGTVLHVSCPAPGAIRLLRDGTEVAATKGEALRYEPPGVGVYRVEVRWNIRPWIFSNPIYLRCREG